MRALGLSMDIQSKSSTLRAVLLQDSLPAAQTPAVSDVSLELQFEAVANGDDLATQLKDVSRVVAGRVESLAPDVVVVRRADRSPRASNLEGPRTRLLFEGAITAAVRSLVVHTYIRTGKECGAVFGGNKANVDSVAERLVSKKSLIPAAAAALAALVGDRA